jgi:hypothetical protein
MLEYHPLHFLLHYLAEYLQIVRVSQIEFEKSITQLYGITVDHKWPKVIYNETPTTLVDVLGAHPHSFILSDYRFWGDPVIDSELRNWLSDNFPSDAYSLQGLILAFRTAKEAMWFRLRWDIN